MDKILIGFIEKVTINGSDGKKADVIARIDTGATKSSIDSSLAQKLSLGPVVGTKIVRSAHGSSIRPLVKVDFVMEGKELCGDFSLANRSHLRYPMLIGQDIIRQGFMIDPDKK